MNRIPSENRKIVRYWDKATTENGGVGIAAVRMSKTDDDRYFVGDVVHGRWSTYEREKVIRQIAEEGRQRSRNLSGAGAGQRR